MKHTDTGEGSADRMQEFLERLRSSGVTLWTENGALRYRAPKGLLTAEALDFLRRCNGSIGLPLHAAPLPRRAPLSFNQLAHWNLRCWAGGRPIRQVASATRVRGRLNVEALEWSVTEVVRRHEALRTRIVVLEGIPQQEVSAVGHARLELVCFTSLPERLREAEVQRHIERAISEPLDYASSSLFRAVLLKLRADEHCLILALDHIVSDGYSLNLVFEEIFTAYTQRLRGMPIELPAVEIQLADHAGRQRALEGAWVEKCRALWPTYPATRFPYDPGLEDERNRRGWGLTYVRIGGPLRDALRAWARMYRTTPVIAILTAYTALILRWCNVAETVIQFMSDGRMDQGIEHTVGYFAFPLYLKIVLKGRDSFVDLLGTVTAAYCRACDQPDFFYAHAQMPTPEFTHNTIFNWLPSSKSHAVSILEGSEDALTCSAIDFAHPLLDSLELDREPSVAFSEEETGLVVEVAYSRSRFSALTMERFAKQVVAFTAAMIQRSAACVRDVQIE